MIQLQFGFRPIKISEEYPKNVFLGHLKEM